MVRSGGGMHPALDRGCGLDKAARSARHLRRVLMMGVFTLYMWIATFRTNFTLGQYPASLDSLFSCLREPTWEWGSLEDAGRDGLGWLPGLDALYLSFAEVTNATFGRKVIVVGDLP